MKKLIHKILEFVKSELVLLISGIIAFLSMIFIPPSTEYLSYIDFRVLSLLFCLMAVVAGFNKTGVFLYLSEKMLNRLKNTRSLSLMLILICFFTSMWITNDVALITFVPLAIMILTMTGKQKYIIMVVVLQTIAANLGSMLTPVGNPQNLYLYSNYNITINEFLRITAPVSVVSLALLCITVFLIKKEPFNNVSIQNTALHYMAPDLHNSDQQTIINNRKGKNSKTLRIIMYCILFLVSLSSVIRLLDYRVTLVIVFLCIITFDRAILKKIDYLLLLTFVFFFLFVGNMGQITVIREFLADLLIRREFLVSILSSQVISNVPASILLSAFTDNYRALILGTNIGGLGTLIASLASLISYKLYTKTEDAKSGKYLGVFTLYNLIFLILLYIFYLIIY